MNKTCYAIAIDSTWVASDGKIYTDTHYVGQYSSGITPYARFSDATTFSSIVVAKRYFNRNKNAILEKASSSKLSNPRIVRLELVKDYTSLLF